MSEMLLYPVLRRQCGLITASQAEELGVSYDSLRGMVKRGIFSRVRRKVYRHEAVAVHPHEDLWAAWLMLSELADDVVVVGESAARLHGLLESSAQETAGGAEAPESPDAGGQLGARRELRPLRFGSSSRRRVRETGLKLHRQVFAPADICLVGGLPVTAPTRTLIDLLEEGWNPTDLGTMVARAGDLGLHIDWFALRAAVQDRLVRSPGPCGDLVGQILIRHGGERALLDALAQGPYARARQARLLADLKQAVRKDFEPIFRSDPRSFGAYRRGQWEGGRIRGARSRPRG